MGGIESQTHPDFDSWFVHTILYLIRSPTPLNPGGLGLGAVKGNIFVVSHGVVLAYRYTRCNVNYISDKYANEVTMQ